MAEAATKLCMECGEPKPRTEFHREKKSPDGLRRQCKACRCAYMQAYSATRRDSIRERNRIYYKAHRSEYLAHKRVRYSRHREKQLGRMRLYYAANKESFAQRQRANRSHRGEWERKKRHEDPNFRIACNLRRRLSKAIRGTVKGGSAVRDLGCSLMQFRQWLEARMLPGMTWDNYGRSGWHIDHIRPLSAFDLTDPAQLKQACHFTNLQPLWAEANLRKGARVLEVA